MKNHRLILSTMLLVSACSSIASAQVEDFPNLAGTPPKVLLLVHQEFKSAKTGERQKLEVAISRACDRLSVPNSWIDLESISGQPGALFFDPFDSFEHIDVAFTDWARIFATHAELARLQQELKALGFQRKDHHRRTPRRSRFPPTVHRFFPRHAFSASWKSSSIPATKVISSRPSRSSAAPTKKSRRIRLGSFIQVNVGMPSPTFLVFVPMHALKQNDDLLDWRRSLREAEGEEAAQRMEQIAKDAYASNRE